MRVLLITSVYPRYAADDQVPWLRQSCQRLAQQGVCIEVLAPSHRGLPSHEIDGIAVHRFRYAPSQWETLTGEEGAPSKLKRNPWLKFLALAYLWCGFWKVARLLFTQKYDLLAVHWPFPHALMAIPARLRGVPIVYHYHSAELKLAARGAFSRLVMHMILPWARAHVANSSYTADLIKAFHPRLPVEVIPYGAAIPVLNSTLDSTAKSIDNSEVALSPGMISQPVVQPRTRVLCVGRHIQRKGIEYLIQAFAHLPSHFTLTLVGEGDQTQALRAQAATFPNITFTGRMSDQALAAIYASHDIFVLPSIVDDRGDTEGLGVVLLEAIQAKLPVIASRVGGIVDVIIDEKTGLLVPPKDSIALANAILRLSDNTTLAKRLVDQASMHAREYFFWPKIAERTLGLYQQIGSPVRPR